MSIAADFLQARELLAAALGTTLTAIKDNASIGNVEEWDSLAHVRLVFEIERRLRDLCDAALRAFKRCGCSGNAAPDHHDVEARYRFIVGGRISHAERPMLSIRRTSPRLSSTRRM